ncbi:5-methylcytosine restriction system specificity protein McrC [Gimesia maris]|uniref:5-methylcytosine restriction system specificity protein McrC n=1 Tax=Gimesia maris TaxID=122 RepID=UPI003A949FAD
MIEVDTSSPAAQVTKTGIPLRNLWYMLLYVWDVIHLKDHWKSDVENSPTFDALLGTILANLIQQRLRIGLGRNYRTHAAEIAGVRGCVDFNESLKRMSFQHGRAFCQFQIFSANVSKNQIIRSTMARLVQIGDFGSKGYHTNKLRSRLRRLVRDMESVEIIELKAASIRREQLNRHDTDYAVMLAICFLLNQRQMPMEHRGNTGLLGLDRDAFTLHNVYERFVAKFYARHLHGWTVSSQQKLVWPTEDASDYLPAMFPDLTLQHDTTGHLIVLDSKFTAKILVTGRWGNQTFNRDHLFQIYAYLKSQEHRSGSHKSSTGILLYPTVNHDLSETIRIQGHSVWWETVDLAKTWQEIEEKLLAIPVGIISRIYDRDRVYGD